MFQKQINMSYPTKTELAQHGEIIRIVQHFDRKTSIFKSKNYFGECWKGHHEEEIYFLS